MAVITVDLTDAMKRLNIAFEFLSRDIRDTAFTRTLNQLGGKLLTRVRRDVAKQAGVKYGKAMEKIKSIPANSSRLQYRITATDKPMKLSEFAKGLKAGQRNPVAAPWGKSRTFKNAFVIPVHGSLEIVKRVQKRTGSWPMRGNKPNGSGKVKVMFGAIIPKEMLRPGEPSVRSILEAIPRDFPAIFEKRLAYAVARAKAASGT